MNLSVVMSHAGRVALRIVVACATEGPGQVSRCCVRARPPALVRSDTGDDLYGGWVVSMSRAAWADTCMGPFGILYPLCYTHVSSSRLVHVGTLTEDR
jgi:hypothetical protein